MSEDANNSETAPDTGSENASQDEAPTEKTETEKEWFMRVQYILWTLFFLFVAILKDSLNKLSGFSITKSNTCATGFII